MNYDPAFDGGSIPAQGSLAGDYYAQPAARYHAPPTGTASATVPSQLRLPTHQPGDYLAGATVTANVHFSTATYPSPLEPRAGPGYPEQWQGSYYAPDTNLANAGSFVYPSQIVSGDQPHWQAVGVRMSHPELPVAADQAARSPGSGVADNPPTTTPSPTPVWQHEQWPTHYVYASQHPALSLNNGLVGTSNAPHPSPSGPSPRDQSTWSHDGPGTSSRTSTYSELAPNLHFMASEAAVSTTGTNFLSNQGSSNTYSGSFSLTYPPASASPVPQNYAPQPWNQASTHSDSPDNYSTISPTSPPPGTTFHGDPLPQLMPQNFVPVDDGPSPHSLSNTPSPAPNVDEHPFDGGHTLHQPVSEFEPAQYQANSYVAPAGYQNEQSRQHDSNHVRQSERHVNDVNGPPQTCVDERSSEAYPRQARLEIEQRYQALQVQTAIQRPLERYPVESPTSATSRKNPHGVFYIPQVQEPHSQRAFHPSQAAPQPSSHSHYLTEGLRYPEPRAVPLVPRFEGSPATMRSVSPQVQPPSVPATHPAAHGYPPVPAGPPPQNQWVTPPHAPHDIPSETPKKQPVMACLFCRGRKIACGGAPPDAYDGDKTCRQCKRRGHTCIYPKFSRRGYRRRTNPLPEEEVVSIVHARAESPPLGASSSATVNGRMCRSKSALPFMLRRVRSTDPSASIPDSANGEFPRESHEMDEYKGFQVNDCSACSPAEFNHERETVKYEEQDMYSLHASVPRSVMQGPSYAPPPPPQRH